MLLHVLHKSTLNLDQMLDWSVGFCQSNISLYLIVMALVSFTWQKKATREREKKKNIDILIILVGKGFQHPFAPSDK